MERGIKALVLSILIINIIKKERIYRKLNY